MAIDPDVQQLLDGVYARLADLETAPAGGGAAVGAVGLADLDSVVDFGDVLTATTDDEDTRLAERIGAVDIDVLPSVPLPVGGGSVTFPDVMVRYVAEDGDDTRDGWTPGSAFKTIQVAYDSLASLAQAAHSSVGEIILLPGTHDIGDTPISLNRGLPVTLRGLHRGRHSGSSFGKATIPPGAAGVPHLMSSSAAPPTAFVTTDGVDGGIGAWGFGFYDFDIWFTSPTQEFGLYLPGSNFVNVERCGFYRTTSGSPDTMALRGRVVQGSGDDCSWWTIRNNNIKSVGLVEFGDLGDSSQNSNQHVIEGNRCFGEETAIILNFVSRSRVAGNNIEGYQTGVLLDTWSWNNTFDGNGGERVALFIHCKLGVQNIFTEQGTTYPQAGGSQRLLKYEGGSRDNLLINTSLGGSGTVSYSDPLAYEDLSTGPNYRSP